MAAAGDVLMGLFDDWEPWHWVVYCGVIAGAMSLVGQLLKGPLLFGCCCLKMPFKGRVHELVWRDYRMITSSKAITCMYIYHSVVIYRSADWIATDLDQLSVVSVVLTLLLGLGFYDALYVPFHRALHIPAIYPLVHKHHHQQINPYRALNDAINVHPFEFISGEYLHILSMFVVGKYLLPFLGLKMHVAGLIVFVIYTGICAQINHTRWVVRIPFMLDTRTHDIHHKYPRSNYCQYVPWWDHFYGSFIPSDGNISDHARKKGVFSDPTLADAVVRDPSERPKSA